MITSPNSNDHLDATSDAPNSSAGPELMRLLQLVHLTQLASWKGKFNRQLFGYSIRTLSARWH